MSVTRNSSCGTVGGTRMADDQLFAQVDDYINQLYGGDDEVLAAAEASLVEAGMPQISVSAAQGRFLNLLVRLCGATRVLEVGTLAAYSTIWMARALPATGRLITIEAEPQHSAVAWQNIERAGLQGIVQLRAGRALEILPQLEAEGQDPFDVIFIDADKPPLTEYFEWALRLSRPGTLIIADNVIREGRVLDSQQEDDRVQGVRRFNEALARSRAVTSAILQTVGRKEHDGFALAVVR
jgi:caffeoyl-CoA O-methyltransferase